MLPAYTEHRMKYGISIAILINIKRRTKRIWKCCHLPWAKQHLFLNDVFALVFLVSHQLPTSAIMLWRYILFFNIVFFVRVGSVLLSSHTHTNDSNESSIFYEYQCLPGNVWACYPYILILTSYILTVLSFLVFTWPAILSCEFSASHNENTCFQWEPCGDRPSPQNMG